MIKFILTVFIITFAIPSPAQNDFLVFKKRNKALRYFYKDSRISFQLQNKEWTKGIITKIENDSFYFTKEIVIYHLGIVADTFHYSGYHYALSDVYAFAKRGVQIDYIGDRIQISRSGGHQHFYWVKSGYIFRLGAAGYAALNIINSIIQNDFTSTGTKLGIAAGVFAGGVLLKKIYKLTLPLGKKYHLVVIKA